VRRAFLATGLLAAGMGCGYGLVGHGVTVDPSIRTIGVPQFKDATGKPGLSQRVTQKVVEELLKRGRFKVVSQATEVDAVVEGELTGYNVVPVGFGDIGGGTTGSKRYGISLSARVVYTKTGQKEPLWSSDAFSERDDYDVGDDPQAFLDREEQAQERLIAAFARKLVSEMLEAF
jgi:hypothetical protein